MSPITRSTDSKLSLSGSRGGYTLIELLVVMLIASILMSMAVPQFTRMMTAQGAKNARDDFAWMANTAKAKAVERGQTYLLEINPSTERAWIVRRNPTLASDTIQTVDFSSEFKADVSTAANTTITICYSPRGFAFSCSANSPSANTDVTFTHVTRTAVARIRPLGQIIRI